MRRGLFAQPTRFNQVNAPRVARSRAAAPSPRPAPLRAPVAPQNEVVVDVKPKEKGRK